jgi:hypothetical protein
VADDRPARGAGAVAVRAGRVPEVPGAAHVTVQTHPGDVAAVLRAAVTDAAAPGGGERARGVSP